MDAVPLGQALDQEPDRVRIAPRTGDRSGQLAAPRVEPLEGRAKVQTGLGIAGQFERDEG